MDEIVYGITYAKPQVVLLQQTGIGVAEVAARTCYDSFENSENDAVRTTQSMLPDLATCQAINEIEESNLLDDLAWTYFHHSILEHANLSYLVRGTSRGVLQEHARHRIQAISVRSTRYTMSSIINAFVASQHSKEYDKAFFIDKILGFDMFVTQDEEYNKLEAGAMYDKLHYQASRLEDFESIAVAKSSLELLKQHEGNAEALFEALQAGKKRKTSGMLLSISSPTTSK